MPIVKLDTLFAEAKLFVPDVYEDDRGFFKETYSSDKYRQLGLLDVFVQDSVSYSTQNVVRGLHYDIRMSKFVQVLRGRAFDVIVDIRRNSPTCMQWQGFYLSADNHRQLYVPPGFAHGFLALSSEVVFSYKQGAHFDPEAEKAIRWNDPSLAIAWPIVDTPRVSEKDRSAPFISDIELPVV